MSNWLISRGVFGDSRECSRGWGWDWIFPRGSWEVPLTGGAIVKWCRRIGATGGRKPKDKARTESTQRWGTAPQPPLSILEGWWHRKGQRWWQRQSQSQWQRQPLNEWKVFLNAAEIDDALDAPSVGCRCSLGISFPLRLQNFAAVECPFYIVSQSLSQLIGGVVLSLPLRFFFRWFLPLLRLVSALALLWLLCPRRT